MEVIIGRIKNICLSLGKMLQNVPQKDVVEKGLIYI